MSDELTEGRWVPRGAVRVWDGPLPQRGVRPPAKCGTDGGYYRHLRTTHTDPCDACLAVHAAVERRRSAARKAAA